MLLTDIPFRQLNLGDIFQNSKSEIFELLDILFLDAEILNIKFKILRSDKKQIGSVRNYYNFEVCDFKLLTKGVEHATSKPPKILSARYDEARPQNKKHIKSKLLPSNN